ncbi:MAG: hypothetical protein V1787_01785 [Candidatus Micrarchaeota archaeon]
MAVKKLVDTWKSKSWYSIRAPKFLNEVEVAQVPALDDEHMMDRIIKIPLKDVTKDLSHVYTTIKLRVSEIKGKTAYAKFIGHEVSREYLHALVRRRMDALNVVVWVTSKDGVEFKVKAVALTGVSCSGTQKTALRVALLAEIRRRAAAKEFGQFIYDTLFGKTAAELFKVLKKIAPLKRVEVRKTELKEVFDVEASAIDKEAKLEGEEGEEAPAAPSEGGSASLPASPESGPTEEEGGAPAAPAPEAEPEAKPAGA